MYRSLECCGEAYPIPTAEVAGGFPVTVRTLWSIEKSPVM
jgi:hypothetical protein